MGSTTSGPPPPGSGSDAPGEDSWGTTTGSGGETSGTTTRSESSGIGSTATDSGGTTGSESSDAGSTGGTDSGGTTGSDSGGESSSGTGGPPSCPLPMWDVDIPPIAAAEAVAVSDTGLTYVVGTHDDGAQTDVWLGAFDTADGLAQWSTALDPSAVGLPNGDELGVDLGLHSSGDLIVLLHHEGMADEVGLLRFDPVTLSIIWWSTLGGAAIDPLANEITPGKVVVSDGDMVVVSGTAFGVPAEVSADQWVARFTDLDGSLQWLTGISAGDLHSVAPEALAVHDTEGIFSIARVYFGVGSTTSSMARVTVDGLHLANFSHPPAGGGWLSYIGRAVAFDQSDHLVVAYTEFWPAPNQGILVERQQIDFGILSAGTTAVLDLWEHPRDAIVDSADLAIVVGLQADAAIAQGWVRIYDPAGTLVGEHTEAVLLDSEYRAVDLAPDGSVVAAGRNGSAGWLRRFDACAP